MLNGLVAKYVASLQATPAHHSASQINPVIKGTTPTVISGQMSFLSSVRSGRDGVFLKTSRDTLELGTSIEYDQTLRDLASNVRSKSLRRLMRYSPTSVNVFSYLLWQTPTANWRKVPSRADTWGNGTPTLSGQAIWLVARRTYHHLPTITLGAKLPNEIRKSTLRLNPVFTEITYEFPEGLDIPSNARLSMLGNAVVPAQAALAWQLLWLDVLNARSGINRQSHNGQRHKRISGVLKASVLTAAASVMTIGIYCAVNAVRIIVGTRARGRLAASAALAGVRRCPAASTARCTYRALPPPRWTTAMSTLGRWSLRMVRSASVAASAAQSASSTTARPIRRHSMPTSKDKKCSR